MSEESEARCPCCGGRIEYSPDQDGSCDYRCIHCGWSQHVPGSENIAAARILNKESHLGSKPPIEPELLAGGKIDLQLLKQQAAILGKIVDGGHPTKEERSCLEGLWEFVHTILDGSQTHGQRADQPTVVVFVHGGVVQGVEGKTPVRVVVCDFDSTEEAQTVRGRPCHIGVWDSPEEPSEEFNEILEVLARNGDSAAPEGEQERKIEGR